jgi:hypothetical protein
LIAKLNTIPAPPPQGIKRYNRSEIPPEFLGSKMGILEIKNIGREFFKNCFFPNLLPAYSMTAPRRRGEPVLNFIA